MYLQTFEKLLAIRKDPYKYLGGRFVPRESSILDLATFLNGYDIALQDCKAGKQSPDIRVAGFNGYFTIYVCKKFSLEYAARWAIDLIEVTGGVVEAYDLFWEVLDEYLASPE